MHNAQLNFSIFVALLSGLVGALGSACPACALLYAGGENQPVLVADVTSTGQW